MYLPCALKLQSQFNTLLSNMQTKMREDRINVESIKNVLRLMLKQASTGSFSEIQRYLQSISQLKTSDELFTFLVEKHFVGYLNYRLLRDLARESKNQDLMKDVEEYEKEFWKFVEEPSFKQLILLFDYRPELNPNAAFGLPIFFCISKRSMGTKEYD